VSQVDENGMTPLHDAGLKSCRHCINLLLLLGCDVKARDANGSTRKQRFIYEYIKLNNQC